ncbi:acetylxylan esterase [Mucilaginibacter polytrichastri]|uniref:Acetyl xylan esterase domain-containing protein n=1 Tax=Mucilaginibacter polytrichastri TaxID=1302689 RepID=A0A1Q6A2L2_9SPHI|nr:acetylxylan esterase [Mucilaginibacter polytrichastri]OKS88250.1 hypothetical protein RG47T_3715 [Mucilaginibacter polytrichastri]SFT27417.1 Cephalosporin-C deacetylase [Mucilaginibacter polytrichastri]
MKKNTYCILIAILMMPAFMYGQHNPAGELIPSLPLKEAKVTKAKALVPAETPVDGEMEIKVNASPKKSLFKEDDKIRYAFDVKSTYPTKQQGKLTVLVNTDLGDKVYEKSYDFKVSKNGSQSMVISLPHQTAGFYQVKFMLNLTDYDDTVKRIFGVAPEKIKATVVNKPNDFDAFWDSGKETLKKIAPQFKVTKDPEQSTKQKDVYLVEMHSWGNAIIRGWLTMPVKRPHHIPVKYRLPGYIVTMKPTMDDDDFAVFNLNVRGNGNSKDAIKYYGQYNLFHIDSRDEYIYRGVYMDCIRGLDFITAYADFFGFDTERVGVVGGSQGAGLAIALAGLDNRVKLVTAELPLYADLRDAIKIGPTLYPEKKSPIWMLNDYVQRTHSFTEKKLFALWDYYDPINFAPQVKCPVLLAISLLDELCPPRCSYAMYNQLGSKKKETWVSPDLTHEVDDNYYQFQYYWIKETFILP